MYIKNGSFKKYTHIISYVPVYLIQQPSSILLSLSSTCVFRLKARGSDPITYKWFKNNFPIPNSNTDTLTLTGISKLDEASYYCRIKNNSYQFDSNVVRLSVHTVPYIITQPTSGLNQVATRSKISLSASGSEPLTYKWYKDNILIENATASAFFINYTSLEDQGYYYSEVSNLVGSITSNTVLLSVTP